MATKTTYRQPETLNARLPDWRVNRGTICGWPGANCIAPIHLSRDLLIRALANDLQERTYGGVSLALRRRLRTLSAEFEKGTLCSDTRIVLKTGTTLVRQWRGRAHTVLVRENGFEYEGQHYRSLTVIAEKITGAHWSGPRFFGLTRRSGAAVDTEAGR